MTEKEKMLAGLLYNAGDEILVSERLRCKNMCLQYNSSLDENIIKELFGKIGKNFYIEPTFFCDYGYNMHAGDNLIIKHNSVFLDVCKITIGDNVQIGANCGFYGAGHPVDTSERIAGAEFGKQITIGNNVIIENNVCIANGVTIGDNCTIGTGSVVTKDLPANSYATGNPCKVVKKIGE